ncbi:MAG: YbfB/YjiJ family MFS transporter [Desulfobulbaceae bacterium]|nr:YbfB/YjiJ family MFS transporter [Desulfobulbaceae bacterium]
MSTTSGNPSRIHYGWHIVWSSTLGIFSCLGLGRFALGMLLPAMGASLGLSYSQMGLISTANFSVWPCSPPGSPVKAGAEPPVSR